MMKTIDIAPTCELMNNRNEIGGESKIIKRRSVGKEIKEWKCSVCGSAYTSKVHYDTHTNTCEPHPSNGCATQRALMIAHKMIFEE